MNLLYQMKDKEFSSQENQILSPLRGWLCNHGKHSLEKLNILEEKGFHHPLIFEGETPMRKFAAYIDPDNRFTIEDKLSQVKKFNLKLR
jgi:carbonic anhydrase